MAAKRGTLTGDRRAEKRAAAMLAKGADKATVGSALGVARQTVSKWANKDTAREWIEKEAQRLYDLTPSAIDLDRKLLAAGHREADKDNAEDRDNKLIEFAARTAEKIEKATGILPTHAPGMVIANIYAGNHISMLSPSVQSMIDQLGGLLGGSAGEIDVTPDDV